MDFDNIAQKFSEVIKCNKCRKDGIEHVLCDDDRNIPQPGFIGKRFADYRIVLIERNPGTDPDLAHDEIENKFNDALHKLGSFPSQQVLFSQGIYKAYERYLLEAKGDTSRIVSEIFEKTNVELSQIAHFNLVRCRTEINVENEKKEQYAPNIEMRKRCRNYFCECLKILDPYLVIFLSKGVYNLYKTEISELSNFNHKYITGRAKKDLREKEINEIVREIEEIKKRGK